MPPVDRRKPAEVTATFGEKIAGALLPFGFEPRSKGALFVRKSRVSGAHRIELGSSHRNAPGHVACWVSLVVTDKAIEPAWRAGGGLALEPFAEEVADNVADASQARALIALVLERLAFFDLVDDAERTLAEVCRRYVPGIFAPHVVVPYLRSRLGVEAVRAYAASLLEGRPELWPAFLGNARAKRGQPDHGTELARLTAGELTLRAPSDAVRSSDLSAANLRSFFGLQLRAWGEPQAAALLRRVDDARVRALRAEQSRAPGTIDALAKAQVVLDAVLGERRAPRRSRPEPRYFQYHVRHEPFAT